MLSSAQTVTKKEQRTELVKEPPHPFIAYFVSLAACFDEGLYAAWVRDCCLTPKVHYNDLNTNCHLLQTNVDVAFLCNSQNAKCFLHDPSARVLGDIAQFEGAEKTIYGLRVFCGKPCRDA